MAARGRTPGMNVPQWFAWFEGIHIQHPGWLWAWLPALLVLALLLLRDRLQPLSRLPALFLAAPYRHPRAAMLRQPGRTDTPAGRARLRWGSLTGHAVLLLCLFAALASPYRLGRQLPMPPEYRDTIFLIDTSISMELRDYLGEHGRVARMAILKSVLAHMVDTLEGSRIGLIVFSERPYTLAPLTTDRRLLRSTIGRLKPAVLTGRTSDLGTALLYAVQQLQQSGAWQATHKPALVLLSDVNRSHRDVDPRAVAGYLHEHGFRLHTIGIGAGSAAAAEDRPAGLIYQPANFRLLKSIAEDGGGQFHWANSAAGLQAAVAAIRSAERRTVAAEPRHVRIALYQWPLLAGLLWLMALELRAAVRRRSQ